MTLKTGLTEGRMIILSRSGTWAYFKQIYACIQCFKEMQSNNVIPTLSATSMLAPANERARTTSAWPCRQAIPRAVKPFWADPGHEKGRRWLKYWFNIRYTTSLKWDNDPTLSTETLLLAPLDRRSFTVSIRPSQQAWMRSDITWTTLLVFPGYYCNPWSCQWWTDEEWEFEVLYTMYDNLTNKMYAASQSTFVFSSHACDASNTGITGSS